MHTGAPVLESAMPRVLPADWVTLGLSPRGLAGMASLNVLVFLNAVILLLSNGMVALVYTPKPSIGYPAGLIPNCPGVLKNASITQKKMNLLRIVVHKSVNNSVQSRNYPIATAAKSLSKDKLVDFKNNKTVMYFNGYFDSAFFPMSQAIATVYSKRGYNVLITETFQFLTYIYPKSVRLSKVLGDKVGEFLVQLTDQGLRGENLELVGTSLGAHISSYAAKYFYAATGKKPGRITGLDPAGPCFRALPPDSKLSPSDAERVDVLHTNMDGFGIAENLGHVDFYVNGGEFQPSDIPSIPCLMICSHVKSALYWWQAIINPKKFIGVKCDSIQDARFARCYNNTETNYAGLETKFNKPGIYYLSTFNEFPYYNAKDGLKEENEIYTSIARSINSEDLFLV
ncbi:lipase member H-B-like [Battus philenor]|uniref:lipase member H-B-like n=1 Tax=Battus philenor TaxID=42288 RepID=UPI0035D0128F